MRIIRLLIVLMLSASPLYGLGFGIGGKVGTMGYGPELTIGLFSKLNCRVGSNFLFLVTGGKDARHEYEYIATAKLQTISILLDWHPFKEKFRISTGLIINHSLATLEVTPTGKLKIGNKTYLPEDIGTLYGTLNFKKHAPFFGIGLGNAVGKKNSVIGFSIDFGVLFQDSPRVQFEAEGMIAPTADQEKDVEMKLSGWKVYGVVALGLTLRLF